MEKKWWIIIIAIIIIIAAIAAYLIFMKSSSDNYGAGAVDFSAGSNALENIGEAANKNAFENVKLNPFAESG